MIGQSVGSDANRLSCFLFRPRKSRERRRKRSHTNVSNTLVTRPSTPPAQTPQRSFRGTAAGTHLPSPTGSHTADHRAKQGRFGRGVVSLPSERFTRSQTSPGRVSERRTLPLLGLGRGCSQRTQRASGQRCAYARRCSEASRPRWAAWPFFVSVEITVFTLCAQGFPRVRDMGGITTLGVLCVLLKRWTAACQSGSFAVSLYPPFTFAKAPAGHCQYALALRTFCLQAESFS